MSHYRKSILVSSLALLVLLSCNLSMPGTVEPRADTTVAAPVITETHLPDTSAASIDKWSLWTGGTHLRGANLHQRRVYPDLDNGFYGPGPLGPPITQADLDTLAALGANYVNLSHPGLFTEDRPYQLDAHVQANLDNLLAMAAQADLFAVISFRTGPGRSEFTFYWDEVGDWFDESYLNDTVWASQDAQDAWVEMWRRTAARYKNNPIVVGYDLMVEPNSNEVGSHALNDNLDIWDPQDFYEQYGDTLYNWNNLYPAITSAIREVDAQTPILIGGLGYSWADWLPYLEPTSDTRTVYMVHLYAPHVYTHQETGGQVVYPGTFDADWDGVDENVNKAWLDDLLSTVDDFVDEHGLPVAVNEFGLVRWAPGAEIFMADQIALLNARGLNHALWEWQPAWEPIQTEIDYFNLRHGPDPDNHTNVPNELQNVITTDWALNTIRP